MKTPSTVSKLQKTTTSGDCLKEFENPSVKAADRPFGADAKLGKVYYEKVKFDTNKVETLIQRKLLQLATPGPMHYDTSEAYNSTRYRAPAPTVYREENHSLHAGLLRKRYFEEKAEIARDEHDDLREASDAAIRPRISSVVIADEKPVRRKESADDKKDLRISAVKEMLESEGLWNSDDDAEIDRSTDRRSVLNVSYSQVESQPRSAVAMSRCGEDHQTINEFLSSKPGVAKAIAEKR
jgi:hypothetical protein